MWKLIKKYAHYNISDLALEADHITREQLETWLEKQHMQKQETSYPKFDFDDILALQCCMETAEKVTEDKELYKKLQSLHSRLHDAYWLEKQGESKLQGKPALEAINEEKVDKV